MKRNLKDFVEAGYKKKSDAKNINGYILDEELSTKRNKVYYNPTTGKVVHTIAGTDSMKDWSNNLLIPVGLHGYSNRSRNSTKIQKKANEKYGKENVDLVTHSQSGHIAENLANKGLVGGKNTTLNPAIIGNHNKDIKVVKSIFDPVSLLTNTNKKDVNIIPKTFNPITEHSTNILDKSQNNVLKPLQKIIPSKNHMKKMFGFGIKRKIYNNLMKYRSEDESEASSSEEEEEHELKGGALHEQDIIDRIAKLSHDIHVHHYKHGIKPSIIKGFKILGEGLIHTSTQRKTGGKINRSKKFNNWFKDIGNKFKPLNKNLSPIKHQMTQSAVDNIAYASMTPEQKAQSAVDMFGDVASNFTGNKKPTKPGSYPQEGYQSYGYGYPPPYYPQQDYYHEMYKPVIAQPVTASAYSGYYDSGPTDFNSQPSSYERSSQPMGFGLAKPRGRPRKVTGGELFSTAGFQKKGGNDGKTKEETRREKDNEKYTNKEASKDTNTTIDMYNHGGFNNKKINKSFGFGFHDPDSGSSSFVHNEQSTTQRPVRGQGSIGKMLKKSAADATVRLLNSGTNRATHEMDHRGKKGNGLKKGSEEMKERMAKMRAMRKCNKK
jgi:hypothetical protein